MEILSAYSQDSDTRDCQSWVEEIFKSWKCVPNKGGSRESVVLLTELFLQPIFLASQELQYNVRHVLHTKYNAAQILVLKSTSKSFTPNPKQILHSTGRKYIAEE